MLAVTGLDYWIGGPALVWIIFAALLYALGSRRLPRRPGDPGERWRTAAFVGGLVAVSAALDSPIDDLADKLFWVHMIQHLLLITVAAPLLCLARPWMRMWHGLPLGFRRQAARAFSKGPRWTLARRAVRFVGDPVPSWLIFNVTFLAWHLPAAYDLTLRSPAVHSLEHALFFFTALLFWTRVIYSPPWRSPLTDAGRAIYVGSTLLLGWVLAIVVAFAASPIYSSYAAEASRPGGISAFTDQQLAAGVMWVPGSIAYTIALIMIAYRWLETKPPASARPAALVRRNP